MKNSISITATYNTAFWRVDVFNLQIHLQIQAHLVIKCYCDIFTISWISSSTYFTWSAMPTKSRTMMNISYEVAEASMQPRTPWIKRLAKKTFLRPNLSAKYPKVIDPIVTPIIRAVCEISTKLARSHTRSHWRIETEKQIQDGNLPMTSRRESWNMHLAIDRITHTYASLVVVSHVRNVCLTGDCNRCHLLKLYLIYTTGNCPTTHVQYLSDNRPTYIPRRQVSFHAYLPHKSRLFD